MTRRFALITMALTAVIGFLTGLNVAGALQGPEPLAATRPEALPAARPAMRLPAAGAVNFADIAERLNPAVVNIDATSRVQRSRRGGRLAPDLFGEPDEGTPRDTPEMPRRGAGSGFIIDTAGHILTNHHVVEGAERITVRLADGRSVRARVVGADPDTDIALIKIDGDPRLPVAVLGDSAQLRVGDWVCAIGNPLGYEHTLTVGVVSYKGRKLFDPSLDNYIQTDAAINFGNSGGPLLNARGEVVGINAAVSSRASNIGFAVPINIATSNLDQLKRRGRVVRGYIGVTLREVDPDLQESLNLPADSGALVEDVAPLSPAERAGIRTYDMIVSIEERLIASNDDLIRTVSSYEPGAPVRLRLMRDGRPLDMAVKLAERPGRGAAAEVGEVSGARPARPRDPGRAIGLDVRDLDRDIARRLGLRGQARGALVVHVEPLSPAYDAEIRRGYVILEINRKAVESGADYRRATTAARPGDVLTFLVHIASGQRALRTVRVEGE
ncbi:MAG TPA: trypsin-like peptidase domain-containing protein [Vicinamibacterales bacterium]|nr:trypsin-like peptidase domain-containing protein [Vicinamibacterales bacterium]